MKTRVLILLISSFSFLSCDEVMKGVNAEKLNNKGLALIEEGDYQKSINAFKSALALNAGGNENRAAYARNLAIAYQELEEIDSAKVYYLFAANLFKPNNEGYLLNMSDVDILNKNISKAIHKLELAKTLNSKDDFQILNSLGLIYDGSYGDQYTNLEKALENNLKAYELQGNRTTKHVLAKTYYLMQNYDKADKLFKELKDSYPQILDYEYYLSVIQYEKGNVEEARILFNDLLKKDSAYYYYGIEILDK